MDNTIMLKATSSLEKIMVNTGLEIIPECSQEVMLTNEKFNFQFAYRMAPEHHHKVVFYVRVEGALRDYVKVSRVMQVPCITAVMEDERDEDVLFDEAGLVPDVLIPISEKDMQQLTNHTTGSFWLEVDTRGEITGTHMIIVQLVDEEGTLQGEGRMELAIVPRELPKQELIHTEWFYCDCLKEYYGTETFDERHWSIIEKFMRTATANGINMLLTPIFTYPLDTAIGHERPTTQLVGINIDENGKYRFNWELFDRFIKLGLDCGYEYFEMGHLFTQWGAKATPKIMAMTPEGEKRIFGWDVSSKDPEYYRLLREFMPALVEELKGLGVEDVTYYHISDEPRATSLDEYKACYEIVSSLVDKKKIIDAMSNRNFYEAHVLERPIPSTSRIHEFLDLDIPDLWTYYCCDGREKVSNRYMAMPLYRTRVLGLQLYKYNIRGFLHWGYNFYFSQFSLGKINPFLQTDCDGFAEAGDAFLVYPGDDGAPLESIRLKAIADAMTDIRLCRLVESLKGRECVDRLIREILEERTGELTFSEYPREAECYFRFRRQLIKEVQDC